MELCADFYFSRIFSFPANAKNGDGVEFCTEVCHTWQKRRKEFEQLRDYLNSVKGRLGKYSDGTKMRSDWHNHTEQMHLFSGLSKTLHRYFGSELTTRAFLKFYDTLARFPALTDVHVENNSEFTSVHLCEAPGAFISALNHRFDSLLSETATSLKWHWFANTLNPYHELSKQNEAIFDDQLIACHPDNWLFGADNTGNIMLPENIANFWSKIGRQSVDFVTADGAIDCQNNPAAQESTLSLLDYAEVMTAVGLLRPGGNLTIKLFTLFEYPTACLVFLLTKMFAKVYVYKPAASKPGNSEVYFVCLDYIYQPDLVELLFANLQKRQQLKLALTDDFITVHLECAKYFSCLQCEAIERNISVFEDLRPKEQFRLYNQVATARSDAEYYFIEKACTPFYPLSQDKKLLTSSNFSLYGTNVQKNVLLYKDFEGKIKCGNTEFQLHPGKFLVIEYGLLPNDWTKVEHSLFCSLSKLPLLKKILNKYYAESTNCRLISIAPSPPAATLRQLFSTLSQLQCQSNENVVIVGVPPPLSRTLAAVVRILLTRFQSVSLKNGAWICEDWQGDSQFDTAIVDHLKTVSDDKHYLDDSVMGVVELVKMSTLISDRTFRASIFQANNNFLDSLQ